tara:strand:- start:145 stop:627 length:483 start_codon:yes stop_codon:yes gene_type:complete
MTNKFYRKPKPETMKKNREEYKNLYPNELSWLNDITNFKKLRTHKNRFLLSMRDILTTGNRKMTPKMVQSMKDAIDRCKNDPRYSDDLKIEANLKIQPILEKINIVLNLAKNKNDKSVNFIESVKEFVKKNFVITKKQMAGLNKIHKKLSEDLFKDDDAR